MEMRIEMKVVIVLQTAGGLRQRKQPVLYATKRAAIFFQGCLHNLDELLDDLLAGSDSSSSYGSDVEPVHLSDGDQGHISAQVILQMYLRTGSDSDKLAMLLSELQVYIQTLIRFVSTLIVLSGWSGIGFKANVCFSVCDRLVSDELYITS